MAAVGKLRGTGLPDPLAQHQWAGTTEEVTAIMAFLTQKAAFEREVTKHAVTDNRFPRREATQEAGQDEAAEGDDPNPKAKSKGRGRRKQKSDPS